MVKNNLKKIGCSEYMMQICICDDNQYFCGILRSKIIDYFAIADLQCEIIIFNNPDSLLRANLSQFKILFLDIDMPTVNGLDVAKQIFRKFPNLFIVFVTDLIQYAREGYRVHAFRYLLKAELDTELGSCIDDIYEEIALNQELVQFLGKDAPVEFCIRDIRYVEGTAYRMVKIHLTDDTITECKGKLADYQEQLQPKGFVRIQRSFLVNMEHIAVIKSYRTYLKNGEKLQMSERDYAETKKQFLLWKGRKL